MNPKTVVQYSALIFFISTLLVACSKDDNTNPPQNNSSNIERKVEVWKSDKSGVVKLLKEEQNLAYQFTPDFDVNVNINETIEYQEMTGFGAALTGSSAYIIQNYLNNSERNELLQSLFSSENGIGISCLRLTIGASDFSLSNYTYNDLEPNQVDSLQTNFDLSIEDEHLIPLLQQILAINPEIKIIASPWSAPAWMKTNTSLTNGGNLQQTYFASYANYFVKYIEAMNSRNIPIYAITIQNEPLHNAPYMSMQMTAEDQKIFIRDYIGPEFDENGIETKIIIYDHNWDNITFPLSILNDETAKSYIDGIAFHCYAGDVSAMSNVHQSHPNKGIYFTECSGGDFAPDYGFNLAWNIDNLIVGASRNWSKTILFWNLALNENNGPKNGGCQDCRGVVTINSSSKVITQNEEFVLLGHISKFVQPKAKRIETMDTRSQGIAQVAFKNPDNTLAIIAFNHNDESRKVQFQYNEKAFSYDIENGMIITFLVNN